MAHKEHEKKHEGKKHEGHREERMGKKMDGFSAKVGKHHGKGPEGPHKGMKA